MDAAKRSEKHDTAADAARKSIALDKKLSPSQERGRDTYETILATAGELLTETGFEQLTTNVICQRAKLTPPALYRYFPNKYAILKVLGDRLMKVQDDLVFAWLDRDDAFTGTMYERVQASVELQARVITATREFTGGLAILRALRAVPMLHRLRIDSRDAVADRFMAAIRSSLPHLPDERLRTLMRLVIELFNATIEMVVEEGDEMGHATRDTARMLFLYLDNLAVADR